MPEVGQRRVRIATIDSGVNLHHPHVTPIAGGIYIKPEGCGSEFTDTLGHGTAVAGAIREKTSTAEIYAVKVFDRALVTSGPILFRAIDWCLDARMDFINLSLGTLNPQYTTGFAERVSRACALGCTIVSAYLMKDQLALPGSLNGVAGVVLDTSGARDRFIEQQRDGRTVYAASGHPRDIPGVPPERNLQGISFAVANVTGFMAARLEKCPPA